MAARWYSFSASGSIWGLSWPQATPARMTKRSGLRILSIRQYCKYRLQYCRFDSNPFPAVAQYKCLHMLLYNWFCLPDALNFHLPANSGISYVNMKIRLVGLVIALVACGLGQDLGPMRPPAVPLVAHDPYFSIWAMGDRLNSEGTKHWTGKPNTLTAAIRIDGKIWQVMGARTGRSRCRRPAFRFCRRGRFTRLPGVAFGWS